MNNKFLLVLILISLASIFIRIIHLPKSINFGSDTGLHLLDIYSLYQSKRLSLIGSPSSWQVNGRSFFTGPAPYYLFMPFLIVAKWHPLSASYLLIFIYLVTSLAATITINKFFKSKKMAVLFFTLSSFLPFTIEHSRFYWHPNFFMPITNIVLVLLLSLRDKKRKDWILLAIGFFLGLGLQVHYAYFLAILLSAIWVYRIIPKKISSYLWLLFGFLIGFSPIILFELRHDFYNLTTLFLYLTTSKNQIGSGGLTYYYIFPIWPFLFLLSTLIVKKVEKNIPQLSYIISILLFLYALFTFVPVPTHGYQMVEGWNLKGIEKVVSTIVAQNKQEFNILDILTGDSRAMALRFLLTRQKNSPLGVTEYPAAKYLFIYSKNPIEQILVGQMWEIASIKPAKVVNSWHIQNGIYLYLIERVIEP